MAKSKQSIDSLISNHRSLVEDQIQVLRDTVVLNRGKNSGLSSILVTAESHGDGSSMIAINLALALAKDGRHKVVLVDADRRKPVVHRAFDLGDIEGLSEVLRGEAKLEDVIRTTVEPPKISVLAYGLNTEQPLQYSQDKMGETLDFLKQSFDFALFNSSPITKYSETASLAARLDAAILVMRAETTKWEGLERAKNRLERVGVNILGVVMNRRRYYIPRFLYKRFFV